MEIDSPARCRRGALGTLGLALGLGILGCGDATAPLFSSWNATLAPTLPYAVSGRAAALTQGGRTRATISIENAEPGVPHMWRIERGTCAAPGALLGGTATYPVLEPGAGGSDSAEAALAELFHPGDSFIVRVLIEGEGLAVITVACAQFLETPP